MAINFPDSPSTNDTHVVGDKTWIWNGTYWHVKQGVTVSSLVDADSDTKIQVEEASDEDIIRFDTAGTERMTIAANGAINVGGTLTAAAFSGPLTGNVTGNASGTALTVTQPAQTAITSVGTLTGLQITSATQYAGLRVSDANSTIGEIVGFAADNDTGGLKLYNAGTANVQLLSSGVSYLNGGNVGIGTASPGEALHIATGSGAAYLKQYNGTATTYLGPDSANTGLFGTSSAHDVRFITTNTERMRILAAGNVGIGTTSPTHKLHVAGATFLLDGKLYLGDNAGSVSSVYNLYSNSSNLFLNAATGSAIYNRINNVTAMVVNVNGISIGNGDGGAAAGTSIKAAGNIAANSTGTYPVVIGVGNLSTPNGPNIAVGTGALAVVTGGDNVAVGIYALNDCTTSGWNVAVGHHALGLTTTQSGHPNYAQYSVAVGHEALYGNVNGSGGNVAMGFRAGKGATTGIQNTFIGMQSNQGASTGSNNICLGYNSATTASTTSNEVTLGNSSVSNLRCQDVTISQVSDERDKTNIQDLDMGLDFICRLQPRRFEWNMRDGGKVGVEETGFVAQELQQAMVDEGKVIPGLVRDDNPDKLEAAPMALFTTLVKAIQELSAKVDALT